MEKPKKLQEKSYLVPGLGKSTVGSAPAHVFSAPSTDPVSQKEGEPEIPGRERQLWVEVASSLGTTNSLM